MKKLIIVTVAIAMAIVAKAASVTWNYTGTASDVGNKIYLFTSAVGSSYESFDDLIADSIGSATVTSKKVGPKTSYVVAATTAADPTITDAATLYYVMISGETAPEYMYGSSALSGYVFDPNQQQSSPQTLTLTGANFSSAGTISSVPEPTSGLLLLVGMAGLALRRKQK